MASAFLYFDGGKNIGLGHATRSVALSGALEELGYDCFYLVPSNSGLKHVITTNGVTLIECSPTPEGIISACNKEKESGVLIVDSYNINVEELMRLKPLEMPLVCFDDTAEKPLPVDLVVNGSPSSTSQNYARLGASRYLLGAKYQIVRHDLIVHNQIEAVLKPKLVGYDRRK